MEQIHNWDSLVLARTGKEVFEVEFFLTDLQKFLKVLVLFFFCKTMDYSFLKTR